MADLWAPLDLGDPRVAEGTRRLASRRAEDLYAGGRHAGWKVGWNDVGFRRQLDLGSGLVGYLTDGTDATTTGRCDIGAGRYIAEVEVALTLRAPVAPDAPDGEVLAAIATARTAIEVVEVGELDVVDALERDVWHHAFALGPEVAWAEGLVDRLRVDFRCGDRAVDVAPPGADKLADVPGMLRFVAGGAGALGARLDVGDVVLTGNLTSEPVWIRPGDRVEAAVEPLGAVAVEVVGP